MSIDARLNRLSPVLTARERAVLVLKSLRAKTSEDPSWRRTMPREQTDEFNRLIVLMNACNIYLPLYISVLNERVQQLYLRFGWLDAIVSQPDEEEMELTRIYFQNGVNLMERV